MTEPTPSTDASTLEQQRLIQRTAFACSILALLTAPALLGAGLAIVAVGLLVWGRRGDSSPKLTGATAALSALAVLVSILAGIFYVAVFRHGAEIAERLGSRPRADAGVLAHWEGRIAPDLELTTIDGDEISLADYRGRRVLVDFWATWCPPCVKQIPHLVALTDEADASEFVVLGVSREDHEVLREFVGEHGVNYTVAGYRSGSPAVPYADISSIPTVFVIDRHGVIQRIVTGYRGLAETRELAFAADSTEEEVAAAVTATAEALAGDGGTSGVGE